MQPMRLLLLFGGRSAEHDVSVASAISMLKALEGSGIDVIPLGITRQGEWRFGDGAVRMLSESALFGGASSEVRGLVPVVETPSSLTGALQSVDVVFPLLHGPFGEDGTVQGLLELSDVPYVGAGVLGSALGMDKLAMKAAFSAAGLPIAPYVGVARSRWQATPDEVKAQLESHLGYPMFIKPANMGSSVGITKVHNRGELHGALELAASYDRRLVVEKGLEARELECGVLGNDDPAASVVGEVVAGAEYYDYEAKYVSDSASVRIPAPVSDDISREVREMAVRAFQAIDAAGMARVDFFLVDERELYVNEINTIPGFTPISQFPRLWQATGLEYPQLVRRLADLALERHAERPSTSAHHTKES